MIIINHGNHGAQTLPIFLTQVLRCEVGGPKQARQHDKVTPMTAACGVARVTVCRGLDHQSTNQIWASDSALAPRDLDFYRLAALQCLSPALGREGRAPGHALAAAHALAYPLGQQHVYRGLVTPPSVLDTLSRDTVRMETEIGQRLGESAEESFIGAYIDHRIGVIRRSYRKLTTLRAMKVHKLPSDRASQAE